MAFDCSKENLRECDDSNNKPEVRYFWQSHGIFDDNGNECLSEKWEEDIINSQRNILGELYAFNPDYVIIEWFTSDTLYGFFDTENLIYDIHILFWELQNEFVSGNFWWKTFIEAQNRFLIFYWAAFIYTVVAKKNPIAWEEKDINSQAWSFIDTSSCRVIYDKYDSFDSELETNSEMKKAIGEAREDYVALQIKNLINIVPNRKIKIAIVYWNYHEFDDNLAKLKLDVLYKKKEGKNLYPDDKLLISSNGEWLY